MSYKNDFIKFMTECGVLTFGDFTLKSGRKAPYFVNTALRQLFVNITTSNRVTAAFFVSNFLKLFVVRCCIFDLNVI